MTRKFAIAFAALAAIGAASLASTAPAAAGWHGHRHWGHHHFVHVRPVYAGCWRKVWVATPYGGFFKRINVCY